MQNKQTIYIIFLGSSWMKFQHGMVSGWDILFFFFFFFVISLSFFVCDLQVVMVMVLGCTVAEQRIAIEQPMRVSYRQPVSIGVWERSPATTTTTTSREGENAMNWRRPFQHSTSSSASLEPIRFCTDFLVSAAEAEMAICQGIVVALSRPQRMIYIRYSKMQSRSTARVHSTQKLHQTDPVRAWTLFNSKSWFQWQPLYWDYNVQYVCF